MDALDRISHVVVLMLENRSFDCLLGQLYPASPAFDGLTGGEFNLDEAGNRVAVWSSPGTGRKTMSIPNPDPGELWTDMNQQIFGVNPPPEGPPASPMSGFVRNYQAQKETGTESAVMHFFKPDQVPALSTLAKSFAVSDRWHASAPCQTWPNRFFMHTATAGGYENNMPVHFPYEMPTIFERLSKHGRSWRVYFEDIPQALTLSQLWWHLDRFHLLDRLLEDAADGSLPHYSFIEPRYFTDFHLPDDMHPPHIVTLGDKLIAKVYNALRAGPKWDETLLIVTFDEHGGCYDHVLPGKAVPPGEPASKPFGFNRYGVRIPTVLASPFIPAGTILRPQEDTPFDHTSILKMLRRRFALGDSLTARDAAAPDPSGVLSLDTPDNPGPETLPTLSYSPTPKEIAEALSRPLNGMQQALVALAVHLPDTRAHVSPEAAVIAHLAALRAGAMPSVDPSAMDMVSATALVRRKMAGLFSNVAEPDDPLEPSR